MNHPMTVGAKQREIVELGLGFPGRMQRHYVMAFDVIRAAGTICAFEVETADLAGEFSMKLVRLSYFPGAQLLVTLAYEVPT